MKTNHLAAFLAALLVLSGCMKTVPARESIPLQAGQEFNMFFDSSKVHTIKIRFTEKNWKLLLADIKKNRRTEIMRKADISVLTWAQDSTPVTRTNIGIRISGNVFGRTSPYRGDWDKQNGEFVKVAWKISFVKRYDPKEPRRKPLFGVRGLKLKTTKGDHGFRNEFFCYDTFAGAGVPSPRFTWAKMIIEIDRPGSPRTVNFGLYKVFEPIDKEFIRKRFVIKENRMGNLYKCLWQNFGPADLTTYSIRNRRAIGIEDPENGYFPAYDLKTNKKKKDHSGLKTFIRDLDRKRGRDFVEWIERNFAVSLFLKTYAISILCGMTDDYWNMGNNYFLYRDPSEGRWYFLPYDYDGTIGHLCLAQGNADRGHTSWRNVNRYGPTAPYHAAGRRSFRPLLTKLLAVKKYRDLYHGYIDRFIKSDFCWSRAKVKFDRWKSVITPYLVDDIRKKYKFRPMDSDYFYRRVFTAAYQIGKNVLDYEIGPYRKTPNRRNFEEKIENYPVITVLSPDFKGFQHAIVRTRKPIDMRGGKRYLLPRTGTVTIRVKLSGKFRRVEAASWDKVKMRWYKKENISKPGHYSFSYKMDDLADNDIILLIAVKGKGKIETGLLVYARKRK